MAHNIKPNQKCRIVTVEIAMPADEPEGAIRDAISGLLSESGTYVEGSLVLDWQYIEKDTIVKATKDIEEGEIFCLPRKAMPVSTKPLA